MPSRRAELWKQYNAEVRFAVVIDRLVPFPSPEPIGHARRIYLLGESHTLPLAWATGDFPAAGGGEDGNGQMARYQLVPRLAIGLKAWHFNPDIHESRERSILLRHAASIPPGSIVVVCAGEIDLRDDGVCALQPHIWGPNKLAKYATSEEAIAATITAFCRGLDVLCDQGHTVLVHPVRPVPPSTTGDPALGKRLIAAWDDALRRALAAMPRVHYLDFFAEMLCSVSGDAGVVAAAVAGATPPSDPHVCGRCGGVLADTSGLLCPRFDIGDGVHTNREYLPIVFRSIAQTLGRLQK
jgi:hypothetical protein